MTLFKKRKFAIGVKGIQKRLNLKHRNGCRVESKVGKAGGWMA